MARKRSLSLALTFFIRVNRSRTPTGVEVLPWAMTAWAADLDSPQSASAFFTQSFWAGVRRGVFAGTECLGEAGLSFGFALASFPAGGGGLVLRLRLRQLHGRRRRRRGGKRAPRADRIPAVHDRAREERDQSGDINEDPQHLACL